MSLVQNERTKLLAAALNTAATSSFTVGVLAPIAAVFYNFGGSSEVPLSTIVIGAVGWISAAVALHLAARWVLKGLEE